MKIQERSFSGKIFQPTPQYYLSSNKQLITVITPWGQEAASPKEVFDTIETQYNFFSEDKDSTHPFSKLISLNSIENDMRTTVIQTNQSVFNNINQEEYSMGFELFFATIVGNIFTVIQIGQPFVLIDRPYQFLQNMGHTVSNSFGSTKKTQTPLPPLPHHLLGIHEDISFHPFFFRLQLSDRLILVNRDTIPSKWFTLKREDRTLENLSQQAAEDNPDLPFWLAVIDFTDLNLSYNSF